MTAAVTLGVAVAEPAGAAGTTVTSTADSGAGSLRAAIDAANSAGGADEITIDVAGPINLTSGSLIVTDDLTIHGGGATVAGDNTSAVFISQSGALTVEDLVVTDGGATYGGGILSCEGPLELDGATVVGNTAMVGAGVFANGDLLVDHSTIGEVIDTLDDAAQLSNTAQLGGGIAVGGDGGLGVPLFDCGGGSAAFAKALPDAEVRIVDSTIAGNGAIEGAGGIFVGRDVPSVSIERSLLATNLANGVGGGLAVLPGAGQTVVVEDSTISSNIGVFGGGGVVLGAAATTGAFAKQNGPYSPLTIRHSTVTGNFAALLGSGVAAGAEDIGGPIGGALTAKADPGPAGVLLDHTIVAGNDHAALEVLEGEDPAPDLGGLDINARYSVLGTGADVVADFPDAANAHNVLATNPLLGALADNGGPTLTHVPASGSPALDAGDPDFDGNPAVDQRGMPRELGRIDIGAVEVGDGETGPEEPEPEGPGPQATSGGICNPAPEDGFVDVPAGNVHEASIDCIASLAITTGGPEGHPSNEYGPALVVSRGQMASFLARVIARTATPLPATPPDAFVDDEGNPHEQAIDQLAALGVINGTSATEFSPTQPLRRDQMASFIANTYRLVNGGVALPPGPNAFGDDDGNVHAADIDALAAAGIVVGTAPGVYSPGGTVARDQMATFLTNLVVVLHGAGLLG